MKETMQKRLRDELFSGWLTFEVMYVTILLLIQVIAYVVAPDTVIGMVSGLFGVIALVYGMKGRKITFIFGLIQCVAMAYVAWVNHAYGSFAMDIVYVISQPIGWLMWGQDESVRTFTRQKRWLIAIGAFGAWLIGWWVLASVHGQLPYFDSINFVVAMIAQVLYILKYRENWSLWIVVNIANLLYWIILTWQQIVNPHLIGSLGSGLSQVALQFALLFNSVYAIRIWNQRQSRDV
ncbi:nicotinamide mononucleotide transporter [Weissella diestrammenae]|uniref:Nicotinamide mononucleotide transporter n=1 Tax=Weissella diestrammenae TaxID=1162633 RepID=A0A7G9T3N2_9LACO|nr:nicotinamide riboside transporter PnuC [Weissella diestrammenae]MCM0582687.1 nicotinamide mononucleotide transporter [Weissella diestrammenae]QNN74707.1 nicotinamide mononucleotide transporter [Weissella diestrammenae]